MRISLYLAIAGASALWACSAPLESNPSPQIKNQTEIEQNLSRADHLEFIGRQESIVAQNFWLQRTDSNLSECQVMIENASKTLNESLKVYLLTAQLASQSNVTVQWDEQSLSARIKDLNESIILLNSKLEVVQAELALRTDRTEENL